MAEFDWKAMIRAGLGGLGLHPGAFWDLTPAELAAMLGLDQPAAPAMTRDRLLALAARFGGDAKSRRDDERHRNGT
jgi:uncharacterized phage protein (TIGR02216 family)